MIKISTTFDEKFCRGYSRFTCVWEGGVRPYMQLQDIFDRKYVQFEKILIMNSDTLKHISKERYHIVLVKPVCVD